MQEIKTRAKEYDFIRFIGTWLIILWHLYTTLDDYLPNLPFRFLYSQNTKIQIGPIGVVIFFALSGSLLHKCYIDKINIKQFYLKRLVRIYLSHMVAYAFLALLVCIVDPNFFKWYSTESILMSFFAVDFFSTLLYESTGYYAAWLAGEWFTTVILIIYLIFPLLRLLYKHAKWIGTALISTIFILNLHFEILTFHGGEFSITNGLMAFWLGMLINDYKDRLHISVYILTFVLLIALLIWNPLSIFGCWYIIPFVFAMLLYLLLTKCKIGGRFVDYTCKYNFEIYLVHHRIFILALPVLLVYITNPISQIVTFLMLTVIICKLAELLQLTTKSISKINFQKLTENIKKIKFKKNPSETSLQTESENNT